MLWIIPMADKGTRTQALGEFKPFIEINGCKIFSWFISSIKHNIKIKDEFLLITLDYFAQKYSFDIEVKKIFNQYKLNNKIKIIKIKKTPNGTSSTIYLAKPLLKRDTPSVIANPDQYINFELPKHIERNSCYVPVYANLGNKAGYVVIKNGLIFKIVEKKNISNLASAGIYIISSSKDLIYAVERQFNEQLAKDGEFYLSEALNYLKEKDYKIFPLEVRAKYNLGTPAEISYFQKVMK